MRSSRPLLVLAAAAVAAGLAFWLLRDPGAPGPGPGTVSPEETRPAEGAAPAVSPGETPAGAPLPAGRGAVSGALAIAAPPGSPAGTAALAVLREGREIARADAPAGLFRLEYPREPGDGAPFVLRAEARGRPPVLVPLPLRETDAGEVRLLAGLAYGGRLVDAEGRPVAGVGVDFNVFGMPAASSPPSAADGTFLVPLPSSANLQGLFGPQQGWGEPPTLEPRARGRLFLPAEAKPEGLAGAHEVVIEERPVAIRLRFLDEAGGAPVAGAECSLWSGQDFGFTLPNLAPFDAAPTDADGVVAPLWPLSVKWALVRVAAGGRVLWTLLERGDAEGKEPRDLVLPEKPLVLAVRCVEDRSGRPVPGAQVVLGTNAGMPLSGTADGAGEIRWALFPSDSFDPEPLEIAGWGASWRDAAGNPRRAMDMAFRGPPQAEEGPSPVYAEPLVLRLGKGEGQGVWVRVDAAPGAEPFRPQVLRACVTPEKGYFLFAGQPAGPVADAAGRPVWWFWEWMMSQGADTMMPKEGTFPVELVGQGRDPLVLRADRAAVLASRRVEGALVFPAPAVEAMARSLLVVGPDGKPVPGALVAVLAGGDGAMLSYDLKERERGATGGDGRVPLQRLDPAGECRVAAWDPATGNSGLLRGLDAAAPPERWRLALEPPREFRVRVSFAGGGTVTNVNASLSPLSGAFPAPGGAASKDGEIVIPSCPVAICTAWIGGFGPREYRWVSGPASSFAGKDVVLEKR